MNESGTKDPYLWEKAWTPDEIRRGSVSWTLAGDAGLLNGMESLAQTLLTKTQEIQKEIDSLNHETRATNSRMHNAISDFLMLSNVQFVENRVYDEEVHEDSNKDKVDIIQKTKEERQAELVPRITEALKYGLNVVENAFEKHQVIDSDSEEDEDNSFHALPVLKPKDFYSHRPLPYVIGTDKFMQDDYAGLGEVLSEDEEESDKDDIDEVHDKKTSKDLSDESTEESDFETDIAESIKKQEKSSDITSRLNERKDYESDEDGELFGAEQSEDGLSSEDDANSNTGDPQVATIPANFAAELAAKLGVSQQVPELSNKEKSEQLDRKVEDFKRTKRRESKDKEEILQQKVTEQISDDEEDSLFKRKNTLFGSGGGLFDDLNEDDESDLFSDVKPKPNTQKEVTKRKSITEEPKLKKPVSLFDDVEDDLFSSVKMADDSKKRETKSRADSKAQKSTSADKKSSIDDSNSEEKKSQRAASKTLSLFGDADDEDDDLFSPTARKKTQSIHVEKDDDLFSTVSPITKETKPNKEHSPSLSSEGTPKKKLPAGAVSMFGAATNSMTELFKAHRHFSESEKEETDSEWSTPEKTVSLIDKDKSTPKDIENGENVVEDIFASGDNTKINNEPILKEEKVDEVISRPARTISLFDDDDEDDLFSNVKNKLEDTKGENKEQKVPDASSDNSSKTSSLFDTEEDNGDDIFQKKLESTPKLRSHSLFDDEDILFSGPSEDAPSVDLFKIPETPESVKQDEEDLTNKEKRKQSTSLFDMADDDEDLFSASESDNSKPGRIPIPAPRKSFSHKDESDSSPKTEEPAKIEKSPKKKPVGGISLFGGIDPFAGKLKSNVEPNKENKEEIESSPEKKSNEPILPGLSMKPMSPSPPKEIAISFEEPVAPNPLKSTCKNRATVQKRRPPTRKGRKAQTEIKNDEVDSKDVSVLSSPDESLDEVANILSPSTEEEDVLTVDELVESKVTLTIFNQQNGNVKEIESKGVKEKKSDDLFASLENKSDGDDIFAPSRKTKSVLLPNDEDDDDLFSSASKMTKSSEKDDLFGGSKIEKKKTVASLFDDDSEEDIFADLKPKKTSSTTKPVSKTKIEPKVPKKSKGLFDDDDDDVSIFDDPLMVKRGNS